jgi:ornithine cyclodeaminase/alanine dehydrogenase-like protein (mu-crystallin family)
VLATDSIDAALKLAREVADHAGRLERIGTAERRGADLTVFKAMGIGLADVALGRAVLGAL